VATVGLHAANGRVLNEPALCCIFMVCQPTFILSSLYPSLYPDITTHVINYPRPPPIFHTISNVKLGWGLGMRLAVHCSV